MRRQFVSEATIRCPKCGEKMRVTLTLVPKEPLDTRVVETEKQIQVEAIAEPKVELDVKAIDWKPWKNGTGEWVNILEATQLFMKIQNAGGQLEHGGYRYWIFGSNRDMIARKKR